ncbi:MAG: HNH endonuclease [Candidatus Altimarinota bacterium]
MNTKLAIKHFWSRVKKSSDCWVWQGPPNNSGYGSAQSPLNPSKVEGAHRISFQLSVGPIPSGKYVCHKCDNRLCVKPQHLFLGTQKENLEDCKRKGRLPSSEQLRERLGNQTGEHNRNAKLNWDLVRIIRNLHSEGLGQREIARRVGVPFPNVWSIVNNKSWISPS